MNITLQSGIVPQVGKYIAVVTIEAQGKAPDAYHSLLLLDCSASMAESIEKVRDNSIHFIKALGDKDYVSVIIYSGHETTELIAGPTSCTYEGKILLMRAIQARVRVMNTTVFSEPLERVLRTVKMFSQPNMVHNAVLFTDGCQVPTHWSMLDEWKRVRNVAQDLYDAKIVVSVIGFGVYYDEEFIGMIMSASGNTGTFRHISEIENFRETVGDIRTAFGKTMLTDARITLTLPVKSGRKVLRVLRATPNVVAYGAGEIDLKSFYEDKAVLFVELSDSLNRLEITLTQGSNREEFLLNASPLTPKSAQEYVRILGACAFLNGNREEAGELLRLMGDDALADRVETSYTAREGRETGDYVRRVFRNREFIGGKLKPRGPNHSLLHVMRTLIEDEESIVYIPTGGYKRGGVAMRDPRIIENPHTRVLRVLGYSSNTSRFNFGLRALKDVKVLPFYLGGGAPQDRKVWRTYNVILDGNRHMSQLEATLGEPSFDLLKEAGVVKTNMRYDATRVYTLDLTNLATISGNYARPQTLGLARLLEEEADLKVLQTALNKRLESFAYEEPSESQDNVYNESLELVQGVEFEYYSAPCVEIRLMGYKPRLIPDISRLTLDETFRKVRDARHRLIVVRYLTRAITFAMETVGSKAIPWGSPKEIKQGKYPKTERLATFDDAKLKRVNWVEQVVCS